VIIIGVDYHPSDQYVAFVDTETGEEDERRLSHSDQEAERFYRELAAPGVSVRVRMEATGLFTLRRITYPVGLLAFKVRHPPTPRPRPAMQQSASACGMT
jgi:hypothetical protein